MSFQSYNPNKFANAFTQAQILYPEFGAFFTKLNDNDKFYFATLISTEPTFDCLECNARSKQATCDAICTECLRKTEDENEDWENEIEDLQDEITELKKRN